MGDFRAVQVGSQIQKNGGNVASHFLTPDGRVIHSVTGPVSAQVLMDEATWALTLVEEALRQPAANRNSFVAWAHYSRSLRTTGQIQKVHQLLSEHPFAPLQMVYQEIFEKILGQRVSKAGTRLAQAGARLELAKRTGRPILFVFHEGDETAWGRNPNKLGGYGPITLRMLNSYVVIVMPLREGPALSQLTKRPPYQTSGSARPLFVVARSDGEQIDALAGWNDQYLASALAKGWVDALERNPSTTERDLSRATRQLDDLYPRLAERCRQRAIQMRDQKRADRKAKLATPPATPSPSSERVDQQIAMRS